MAPPSRKYKLTKIVGWLVRTKAGTVSTELVAFKLKSNSVQIRFLVQSLLRIRLLAMLVTINPSGVLCALPRVNLLGPQWLISRVLLESSYPRLACLVMSMFYCHTHRFMSASSRRRSESFIDHASMM